MSEQQVGDLMIAGAVVLGLALGMVRWWYKDRKRGRDEAWQTFFDVYILPAGTVDNVSISFS